MDSFTFDYDDLIKFLKEKTGCSVSQAMEFCDVEEEYLCRVGLQNDPDIRIDPKMKRELETVDGVPVINAELEADFIERCSMLDRELIYRLQEAESDYFELSVSE